MTNEYFSCAWELLSLCFVKESPHLIVLRWNICLWNFLCSLAPKYTEWYRLPLIRCHTRLRILAFTVITYSFVCCVCRIVYITWGEACDRRVQNFVPVFLNVLCGIKDCSLTKGRIHVLSLRLGSNRGGHLWAPPIMPWDWLDPRGCASYTEVRLIDLK